MTRNKHMIVCFFLSLILSSCVDKKIEQFKITIVLTHELGSVGDPLNNGIKSLCNYFVDATCPDKVFVPFVMVVRPDVNPERQDSIVVQLSGLNKWRKSMKLLSAPNLMEDYDENVPKLTTPDIVALRSQQPIDVSTIAQKYPNPKFVLMGDSMIYQLNTIKAEICSELCRKSVNNYTILFYNSPQASVPPHLPEIPGAEEGDDCRYEFCKEVKKGLLEIGTCSVTKIYKERFALAEKFVESYFTENIQVDLLSPEGFSVNSYTGKKAHGYIFELANENRCVLDFKIVKMLEVGKGKISLLRLREYDKK